MIIDARRKKRSSEFYYSRFEFYGSSHVSVGTWPLLIFLNVPSAWAQVKAGPTFS